MLKKFLFAMAVAVTFNQFCVAMEVGVTPKEDAKQEDDRLINLPKKQKLEEIFKKHDLEILAQKTGVIDWLASDGSNGTNTVNLMKLENIKNKLLKKYAIILNTDFDNFLKELISCAQEKEITSGKTEKTKELDPEIIAYYGPEKNVQDEQEKEKTPDPYSHYYDNCDYYS